MPASQSWPKRIALAVAACLVATWSSLLLPGYALGAPGGNNGDVKLGSAGQPFTNSNDPHLTCPIQIQWTNFDPAGATFDVAFSGISPTGGTVTPTGLLHGTFTTGTHVETYGLAFAGATPHNGEYHVGIDINTSDANGSIFKQKTIWVQGCTVAPQNVTVAGACNTNTGNYDWTVSTSPATGGVAGTYTPTGGNAANWSTANGTGTATFNTGHVNSIGYTVTTAGWTASTASPVTATQNNACNAPAGPDVGITKDGTSAAFVGDPVTYTIVATVVNGPTSGTTTVADTLPNGITNGTLTYTSGAGTWNCAALTCSTTSVLATGNTTTFTVNATASAAGNQQDSVTVTAVGDTNATNNTATKTTVVTAPGSLTLQATCGANAGQVAWTVTNPASNPTVNTLVASNGATLSATTLAPGANATFTTPAPQNTALTVSGKTTPGNQNVGSNALAFNGSCTNPGTPETPASIAFSSTCTGIHAVFTSADQHTTVFTVTAPHNVSDTVNGSATRDYNADKNDGHLSVSFDGKSQTYDWVDPGNCSTPPPPGQPAPDATASNACVTGITVLLSNMNGTAPATFTVTAPDGTTSTVDVNAGQLKKLVFAVAEDTTGVVTVSAPGLAKTFSYAKNCTKVLGEKHTVKPPKTPTKVLGEKGQLPFTGFNAKSALFDAASLVALGAIVCALAMPRRRRFGPHLEG